MYQWQPASRIIDTMTEDRSSDTTSTEWVQKRSESAQRIVEAAADILAAHGRSGMTTRAVAAAAGVQPPAIYRHFGDMTALLDAVAEHGFAVFLATKRDVSRPRDPVEDLRVAFDLAVEFGTTHPALYLAMYSEPGLGTDSAAYHAGMEILRGRVRRLAAAGRLRVDEDLAIALIQAMTRGAVLTWLSQPESSRDHALFDATREALVAALVTVSPTPDLEGPEVTARALLAQLSDTDPRLSHAEHMMLSEWLTRLSRQTATATNAS
jgi:AcrR family transcriptional regulator